MSRERRAESRKFIEKPSALQQVSTRSRRASFRRPAAAVRPGNRGINIAGECAAENSREAAPTVDLFHPRAAEIARPRAGSPKKRGRARSNLPPRELCGPSDYPKFSSWSGVDLGLEVDWVR